MRTSIRTRVLVVVNLLVLATAVVLGWLAAQVAGQVVEQRLVSEVAANTARFLGDEPLPLSDALMTKLRQMFAVHFVATRRDTDKIVASSLPPDRTQELARQLAGLDRFDSVALSGARHRVAWHQIVRRDPRDGTSHSVRLHVLVPAEQFTDARTRVVTRITRIAVWAVVAASVLAVALSFTIIRPIRGLSKEMDRLAQAHQAGTAGPRPHRKRRGPVEVVRLADSFDRLLTSLEATRAELARSERLAALGKVAAGVAHELRNPLSGIKMNVRILQDELADGGAAATSIGPILNEIDRMDLYLQELMSLAADAGRSVDQTPPRLEDLPLVRLDEVADSVVELLAGQCEHMGVRVERARDASAAAVRANATQMRQVVMNLMINAVEAMPSGGVIRLAVGAGEGGRVRFCVHDTGGGVHADEAGDIFEAFVSTRPNGAGLGLHLCKKVVEAHRGRIGYRNTDEGAMFWFELPAAGG